MCSSRWEIPICSRRSWALAVRTYIPTAAERTPASVSVRTTSPFGAVVRSSPWSRDTVSTELLLGQQRLSGQLHAAPLVDLEQLDLDDVALLDHVLGLLGAPVLELADVEQPLDPGKDLDERPERRGALDRPLVGPAHLGLGGDRRDHGAGLLARFAAHRADGDHPAVLDADLGAGGVLDAPDRLPLVSVVFADLVGLDLHGEDPRRVLGELR